jgi:hypothetical protein
LRKVLLLSVILLAGCAPTWSTSDVTPAAGSPATKLAAKQPADVFVTENDVTDKPYVVLGDISVTVNKTTIFDKDPTREAVTAKLKDEAAKLGADAVVLARFGTVGIGFASWGSMDGKGRAIAYKTQ